MRTLEDLKEDYKKLQLEYGEKDLDPIYFGGKFKNPDICFVFMNPTGKNISSEKSWKGLKAPWIGTKNIWKLFNRIGLISNKTQEEILNKKPNDWDYEFSSLVYKEIEDNNCFITNLGKCTQIDARPLKDETLRKYLNLLYEELEIVNPKIIITFGNQVSSIVLDKKISVSKIRKEKFELKMNSKTINVFPVYYPVGNAIYNMDKAVEDINWIIKNYV